MNNSVPSTVMVWATRGMGLHVPLAQYPMYDNLEPKGKMKDYKAGGFAVKFETMIPCLLRALVCDI